MSEPTTEIFFTHPDIVTAAIKLLVGAVMLMGSGFIGTILYIWNKADNRIINVETKMDRIAASIENMDKTTSMEIAGIKIRCSLLHAGDPHAHIRSSDLASTGQE